MDNKFLGLRILWWTEMVVSVRILFFTLPVVISKYGAKEFSPINLDDWFILVVTLAAFLYMAVGMASIAVRKKPPSWPR